MFHLLNYIQLSLYLKLYIYIFKVNRKPPENAQSRRSCGGFATAKVSPHGECFFQNTATH